MSTTLPPTYAPTFAPTAAPSYSQAPTFAPTKQVYPILEFNSSLSLDGLASPTLSYQDQLSVINATARSMGVDSNSVEFLSYHVVSRRRLGMFFAQTQTYSVVAVTKTSVLVTSGSSSDAYTTYSTLLSNAVTSDTFTTYLQSASVTYGSTNLANADATGVVSVPDEVSYPGSDDDGLTDGQIAGIVIGTVFGFFIIVGLVYYFFFSGSSNFANRSHQETDIAL